MTSERTIDRMEAYALVQSAIAVCKEEVETVVSADFFNEFDNGSPWGRSMMRMMKIIDEEWKA